MKYISNTLTTPASLFHKTGGIVATALLGGLALMFSAILLVVILSILAVGGAVLMWKTRELRKQIRNTPPYNESLSDEKFNGEVIEGESIRVDESKNKV